MLKKKQPIGCFYIEDTSAALSINQREVVLMRLNHVVIYDFILSLFLCDRINLQEKRDRTVAVCLCSCVSDAMTSSLNP